MEPIENPVRVQLRCHVRTPCNINSANLRKSSNRGTGQMFCMLGFHMTSRPPCWCPKQGKGGHVGAPTKSSGNLSLLLWKRFLLFSLKSMAVDHKSENQQLRPLPLSWINSTNSLDILDAPERLEKAGRVFQPGKATDDDLQAKDSLRYRGKWGRLYHWFRFR